MSVTSESIVALVLAVMVLGLKPGPYMMAFVSMSLNGQWRNMLIFWLGSVIAGTLLYFTLLSSLSLLPLGTGIIFIVLKSAAALIFINMGVATLLKRHRQPAFNYIDTPPPNPKITNLVEFFKSVTSGFFLTLSNPYDILFILTAIPALLATYQFTFTDIGVVRGIVVFADTTVLLAYCLPVLLIRNFMEPRTLKRLEATSGVLMICIGVYLLINMILHWDLHDTGLISKISL